MDVDHSAPLLSFFKFRIDNHDHKKGRKQHAHGLFAFYNTQQKRTILHRTTLKSNYLFAYIVL